MSAYGPFYLAAIVLFFVVVRHELHRAGVVATVSAPGPSRRWIAIELTVLFAFSMWLMAHFLFAAVYKRPPNGFFGGYGFFVLLLAPYLWLRHLPREAVLDAVATAMPLSMVLAKIACYAGNCCFGAPVRLLWTDRLTLHPTQLYDATLFLLIGLCVLFVGRKGWLRGRRLLLTVLLMGAARVLTESFRGDPRPMLPILQTQGEISVARALAAVGGLAALLLLVPLQRLWSWIVPQGETEAYVLRIKSSDDEVRDRLGLSGVRGAGRLRGIAAWFSVVALFLGFLLSENSAAGLCVIALSIFFSKAPSEAASIDRVDGLWPWLLLLGVIVVGSAANLIWPQANIAQVGKLIPALAGHDPAEIRGAMRSVGYLNLCEALLCLVLALLLYRRLPAWYRAKRAVGLL